MHVRSWPGVTRHQSFRHAPEVRRRGVSGRNARFSVWPAARTFRRSPLEKVVQVDAPFARWAFAFELLPLAQGNRGVDDGLGTVDAEGIPREAAASGHNAYGFSRIAARIDRPPHILDAVDIHVVVDHDTVLQPAVRAERSHADGFGLA